MLKKLTFAAGFGAGYVLGAKAGRERYTQIEATFREIAGMPAVQHAAASVQEAATGLADTATTIVTEQAADVVDSARAMASDAKSAVNEMVKAEKSPVIDLSSGAVGASPAPMAGAAASATAPDTTRP